MEDAFTAEDARQAVARMRQESLQAKLERFKPLYFIAADGSLRCPACGRVIGEDGWQHGVGTKWGDACIRVGS